VKERDIKERKQMEARKEERRRTNIGKVYANMSSIIIKIYRKNFTPG